ncbi:MAG TPA: GIY-YIG nuclease family protein [Candidatus Kapabacteria bacterium]|nr:GIY-YIG nuclease family protein [Candidatus Kapabacteria bacterium]
MKTRDELKEEYKLRKSPMGVFQIRNTSSGRVFIASSTQLDKAWNRHKFQLELNGHPNKALQKEWNEFGESQFVFEIIEEMKQSDSATVNPTEEVKLLEQLCLERFADSSRY